MAGHSHSKNIKIRKAAVDGKRSRLFSKLARLVITAARDGADVRFNPKLAFAVAKAKAVSLPRDTIEKAIKKGAGETDGVVFEQLVYEGYAPGGVAVMADILTDNRNRTAGEIRKIFDICGGKLGTPNCVAFGFTRRGQFILEAPAKDEDALMEFAMEAGADDLRRTGDCFEILCDPSAFMAVQEALSAKGLQPLEANVVQLAENTVKVHGDDAAAVAKLIDRLDEHDDVQNVFTNADLPEDVE